MYLAYYYVLQIKNRGQQYQQLKDSILIFYTYLFFDR